MSKSAIITFAPNFDKSDPVFLPDTPVFSIPYSRILIAEEFCSIEELEYCFVGYRDFNWHIQATDLGLDPCIKVTEKGISQETRNNYISHISEI